MASNKPAKQSKLLDKEVRQIATERLAINKTYKMYVDGKFVRSESGRYFKLNDRNGNLIANVCRASRKDFRDAVVVARKAHEIWNKKTAYNKGQILYRIAEMLESRIPQFITSLMMEGYNSIDAEREIEQAVDALVYYAGWSDKYIQVFSSVNPVESSHFNFSIPEPSGVVSIIAPANSSLLGLVSVIAPAIVGGNAVIVLANESFSLTACEFSEVLNSSDVTNGVVNILTGHKKELLAHFSNHMDVNAMVYGGTDADDIKLIENNAALNVKRIVKPFYNNWHDADALSPYHIIKLQEIKTTWHPIGL